MSKSGLGSTLNINKKKNETVEKKKLDKMVSAIHDRGSGIKRMSVEFPSDLHRKMKIKAATEDMSMREYIISLLERDLL